MKSPKNALPNAALAAATLAGTLAIAGAAQVASAASVDPDTILETLDAAGVEGDITVTVDDAGVAYLSGTVDEPQDAPMAVNAASQVPGVTQVVDQMRWND